MFKKIPGNTQFQIDLFGNIQNVSGAKECTPIVYNNQVKIELYAESRIVDVDWLALIAHFEVELPEGMESRIFDIHFEDTDLARKSVTNKMMLFKKPIRLDMTYRVIPCFTRYAISKEGVVIEVKTRNVIEPYFNGNDYVKIYIYDPEYGQQRDYNIHRLVAMTWVHNKNYFDKPIVNHKDGNKRNFHYMNLEWVSYTENSLHAVNTGLRNDNFPCKVFDILDRSVKDFPSIKQACVYMGLRNDTKSSDLLARTKNRLINDRFQIKLQGDTSEWFYKKHNIGTIAGRYSILVTKENGIVEEHPDVRTFKRMFKVWNVSNIDTLIAKAKFLYPCWTFSYVDHYVVKPVQAYEIATKKILEAEGIRQLSRMLKIGYNWIRNALLAGETRVYNGYAFRYKTDAPWNTSFAEYKCRSKCILATPEDLQKQKLRFDSERKASVYFNTERSVVRKRARNHQPLKGYILEYVTD